MEYSLKELFKLIDDKKLVMPDFQRDYVWNKEAQSGIAASILLGLPIGSFLLLSGGKDDFATKELGFPKRKVNPKEECKFLLDGQQRLTSLRSIFADMFKEEELKTTTSEIYSALKKRWFISIIPSEGQEDIFGWEKLYFDSDRIKRLEPSDVETRIIDKPIGVTKSKSWWNPDYIVEDNKGNKITDKNSSRYKSHVARKMAEEGGLIPLYSIYNDDMHLIEFVLDGIADSRKQELKAILEDDKDMAVGIFERINPEIELDEIDSNVIDANLPKLAEKWKQAILGYFSRVLVDTITQVIDLPSDEIARAVSIFERINKGGTRLDNFDLVVARAARDASEESLSKRIISYLEEKIEIPNSLTNYLISSKPQEFYSNKMDTVKSNEIDKVIKTQYLNLLSISANTEYGEVEKIKLEQIKKDKILNISHVDINRLTKKVILALKRACAFLNIRCGIVRISELHYKLMIIPIAYMLMDDRTWNSKSRLDKIEYWYWGSILSGDYRLYPNEKTIKDLQELFEWINSGKNTNKFHDYRNKILNIEDYSDLSILTRRTSEDIPVVIHKTLLQYQLSKQPKDMLFEVRLNTWELNDGKKLKVKLENKNYELNLQIEDHHIIPLGTCTTILESTRKIRDDKNHPLNSILNRTYILKQTNMLFSDKEPIKYLEKVKSISDENILNDHFITSDYKNKLNNLKIDSKSNILEFLELRYELIKNIILSELNTLYHSID